MSKIDTKRMKKDFKQLAKDIGTIATNTTRTVINRQRLHASFDEVEVVPYSSDTEGRVTVSGAYLADSPFELETALTLEKDAMERDAVTKIIADLKGVLR